MMLARVAGRRWLSAASVKADVKLLGLLRKETDLSVSKCKDALVAFGNDYDKALDFLRESEASAGMAKADKLKDRTTGQGAVGTRLNDARDKGAIWEMHSETDFVARNTLFLDFAYASAGAALTAADLAASLEEARSGIPPLIGKLGENISIRRLETLSGGLLGAYTHALGGDRRGGQQAAIVKLEGPGLASAPNATAQLGPLCDKLAQHVMAMLMQQRGNPEIIAEIAKQPFVFDPDVTVQQRTHWKAD